MKRTINETGRKRILQEDFTMNLGRPGPHDPLKLEVEWNLNYLGLPQEAELWLHCVARGVNLRFFCGPLGAGIGETSFDLELTVSSPVLKVEMFVSEWQGGVKKILASAAPVTILLAQAGSKNSFLRVNAVSDLDVLSRVSFETGEPILEVPTKHVGSVSEKWFMASVLPQVVREVYLAMALNHQTLDEGPRENWTAFFKGLGIGTRDFLESDEKTIDGDHISDAFIGADEAAKAVAVKYELLNFVGDNDGGADDAN